MFLHLKLFIQTSETFSGQLRAKNINIFCSYCFFISLRPIIYIVIHATNILQKDELIRKTRTNYEPQDIKRSNHFGFCAKSITLKKIRHYETVIIHHCYIFQHTGKLSLCCISYEIYLYKCLFRNYPVFSYPENRNYSVLPWGGCVAKWLFLHTYAVKCAKFCTFAAGIFSNG